MRVFRPRLLVAGTSGDSGKTVVSVGLARAWSERGLPVAVFKKGPDYIDAAWLSAACGKAARNLDTFLASESDVKRSFALNAVQDGVNIIEGNRGLHDGFNVEGTHSSAALSKLIECPVILVQDVTKTTRSAAAFLLGSKMLDKGVNIAGVILNKVAGARHEETVRRSIEKYSGVPVLGAIPKLTEENRLPMRHLGLVTPREENRILELIEGLSRLAEECLDLDGLRRIADGAHALDVGGSPAAVDVESSGRARVCYLCDSAFSFYYPENLEALKRAGARLIPVSALEARELPECDALYVGGGFPETHATALAGNGSFRESVRLAAEGGLPVYAECGGLVYLAEELVWKEHRYPMAGVFPIRVVMDEKPHGHGYGRVVVDGRNPFFEKGTELKGHEFHYSHPDGIEKKLSGGEINSVFGVKRGAGCGGGRDGLVRNNVLGTYLHIHALGCPAWACGLVKAAERHGKE